jgi:hypothetical protein
LRFLNRKTEKPEEKKGRLKEEKGRLKRRFSREAQGESPRGDWQRGGDFR